MKWIVDVTKKCDKQIRKLPVDVQASYFALALEIESNGPYRINWSHYGKLSGSSNLFHCHISSGRPTYVVCWELKDKSIRIVEVYYVGTHEKAPY